VTVPLREARAEVLARLRAAPRVFCFLDYDGTLAALAPTPEEATPLPGTGELLGALATAPNTGVAIVTGRPIADVRRFLDVAGAYYIGIHGVELQSPNGLTQVALDVPRVRPVLQRLRQQLDARFGKVAGIVFEDKGTALACHYRLAARQDGSAVRRVLGAMVRAAQRQGAPLILAYGHEVAEVRPAGVNKGRAVCALLAAHAPQALPVYAGDDRTDEDAFALLPPPAITLRVGAARTRTHARYRVGTPAEVQAFLRALLAARRASAPEVPSCAAG
jgi:trehalose-phosphatase